MSKTLTEGWWFPTGARKAHYMINHIGRVRSLCREWTAPFARSTEVLELQPDDGKRGPDDCATCRRKLDRSRRALT